MFRPNAHRGVHAPSREGSAYRPPSADPLTTGGVIDPDITVEISGVVEGPGS